MTEQRRDGLFRDLLRCFSARPECTESAGEATISGSQEQACASACRAHPQRLDRGPPSMSFEQCSRPVAHPLRDVRRQIRGHSAADDLDGVPVIDKIARLKAVASAPAHGGLDAAATDREPSPGVERQRRIDPHRGERRQPDVFEIIERRAPGHMRAAVHGDP